MTLARCKLIPDLYLDESGSHSILHGACSRVQEPQFDYRCGKHMPRSGSSTPARFGAVRPRQGSNEDYHALRHLAGWLADHGQLDELLTDHRELLASSWGPGSTSNRRCCA
jgi:hypothetical protein